MRPLIAFLQQHWGPLATVGGIIVGVSVIAANFAVFAEWLGIHPPAVTATPLPTPLATAVATPVPTPIWAPATSPGPIVQILTVEFDPRDATEETDEYVVIANNGSQTVNMTGWRLCDEELAGNKCYRFPQFTLDPGQMVKVWTGTGEDSAAELFWDKGQAVWNNDHDTATLSDSADQLVCRYCYPDACP
jgi:hypothetical protein